MINILLAAGTLLVQPSDIALTAALEKPTYEHRLTKKHAMLDKLELEDHSVWDIAPPDSYLFAAWDEGDTVVLTPHSSRFSIFKYDYSLSNTTKGNYVRVNFLAHPCDYQKTCRWVISLDHFSSKLFLNDGSAWKIHPDDVEQFKAWDINDFIIYGSNNEYFWSSLFLLPINAYFNHVTDLFSSYPFLLINARLNHSVRALEF